MLISLSIDHRRADLRVLERIQQHASELTSQLHDPEFVRGSAMVATCNRFEAYFDGFDGERSSEALIEGAFGQIAEATGLPAEQLSDIVVLRRDAQAAEHLFSVSSGLESVVVGEGEIAGQVRRSLELSREAGTATSTIERLFQTASRTSRLVKQRTGIQSAGRSIVRLALAMVDSRIGDWGSAKILIIGTGSYAGASLAALRARGAKRISVFSPSGRAYGFAAARGIEPVAADELDETLMDSDVVVACSHTREPLITAEQFERTRTPGRQPFCETLGAQLPVQPREFPRPRLLIDMGMPRNIARSVTEVPGVELIDLDLVAKHVPVAELSAEAEARRIVRDATLDFFADRAAQDVVPSLVALRDYAQGILQDELGRLAKNGAVAPELEAALKHLTGRLLHRPTVSLREAARQGRAAAGRDAVELLFGEAV